LNFGFQRNILPAPALNQSADAPGWSLALRHNSNFSTKLNALSFQMQEKLR